MAENQEAKSAWDDLVAAERTRVAEKPLASGDDFLLFDWITLTDLKRKKERVYVSEQAYNRDVDSAYKQGRKDEHAVKLEKRAIDRLFGCSMFIVSLLALAAVVKWMFE
jgi:hypothetical protein